MSLRLFFCLTLALATGAVHAQAIYRCGKTYSQTPCPEGGKIIEATDPRSAAQRAEARRIAAAERRAAAARERERRALEKSAQSPNGAPVNLGAKPAAAASAPAAPAEPKKDFVATVPKK
jgi:hypothetical protein